MKKLLILFLVFFSQNSFAKGSGETILRWYDDGETKVFSPHIQAKTSVYSDNVELSGGYTLDVLSSSSSDVRSWASGNKISDTRKEYELETTLEFRNGSVGMSYVQSDEADYHSQIVGIGTSRDFFEKNTTLSIGASFGTDHINHAKDAKFDGVMKASGFSLGLTQVLSRKSLVQILYDGRVESGFLSSPYRVARILQPDGSVIGMPENTPNGKARHSFTTKYNYYLDSIRSSLSTSVRFYIDTWGVKSLTVEPKLTYELSKATNVEFDLRYYKQLPASFYKDKYNPADQGYFLSGNKTLSDFSSILVGVRPTINIGQGLALYFRYEYYKVAYSNYTNVGTPSDATDDQLYTVTASVYAFGINKDF